MACIFVFLQYYALDVTYFKSSLDCHLLDLLWNKYWVNTLSSSPLLANRDYVAGQISDLGESMSCFCQRGTDFLLCIVFRFILGNHHKNFSSISLESFIFGV